MLEMEHNIMEKLLKSTLVTGFALIALGATIAVASSDRTPECQQPVGTGTVLSIEQVTDRITALGYTSIRKIEREDGCFEIEARGGDNREMELRVHAVTGEILRVEEDD